MGTDVALMLGIAHTLMTQGKHDKVFLENTLPDIRSLKSIWQARAIIRRRARHGRRKFLAYRKRR